MQELYEVSHGRKELKTALGDYAEEYARLHKEDYLLHPKDYVLMNVDFAVVDLAKLKNVWAPLKNVVDFLCENYKAADSAKYEIPSREAYQYYNKAPKYDLMDYLALMMGNGAPYENNEQYKALYNALDDIMESGMWIRRLKTLSGIRRIRNITTTILLSETTETRMIENG